MKNFIIVFIVSFILGSCANEPKGDATRFKTGTFSIPAGKGYSETIIERLDSIQYETYTKFTEISTDSGVYKKEEVRIDTLFITWKNNFFYTLKMKSPKTDVDKDPIFVQITKVKEDSYEFSAKIGYSNFAQKGIVYKLE